MDRLTRFSMAADDLNVWSKEQGSMIFRWMLISFSFKFSYTSSVLNLMKLPSNRIPENYSLLYQKIICSPWTYCETIPFNLNKMFWEDIFFKPPEKNI